MRVVAAGMAIAVALGGAAALAADPRPAKELFGAAALPADSAPKAVGFYSRGCLAGGVAIPVDGPDWQVMRLSRNRRWGHPDLVKLIEQLSVDGRKAGWNGLMVGDMSQPRGGPMLTGHASHQIGLDVDLWFMPMPDRRLDYREREDLSAISVLKDGSVYVDDRRWTKAHENLLRITASYSRVERILVHPGVKKKLCDSVRGDRGWLAKIRPYYGHHYHFHVRITCPAGSPGCKPQDPVAAGDGCDKSLDWWFDVALKPKKPSKSDKPAPPPRPLTLAGLPGECADILAARSMDEERAEYAIRAASFQAPQLDVPSYDPAAALASKPIEASRVSNPVTLDERAVPANVPVPQPSPRR
jgi:penicillin-insensitive murein endopeptidase